MASNTLDERPTAPRNRPNVRQNKTPSEQNPNRFSKPSSSTDGFFQTPPRILNQLYEDAALDRVLGLFVPSDVRRDITPGLAEFGDKVLGERVLNWVADAEKNLPYLRTWDTWGKRKDELVTSEGWRNLQDLGIKEGMVSIAYDNKHAQFSRIHHFAKYHLWCGSSAWVNCPSLMTDGVAALFRNHLSDPDLPEQQRRILQSAYSRLTSCDPAYAWTTGQWMTERAGGSDVSQTETLATYQPDTSSESNALGTDGNPLGPWLVNGFKWFSSATDSQMTVFLARTSKGVSLFFAPMRRTLPGDSNATELNGITIQRLKQKLGTRALPTAELELKGTRAYLIGEEGRGTKQIATVLNIARVHNAASSVGFWGRGLAVARAFARCRTVGLKPLHSKPAHLRMLARMHAEYRANMLFTFFVVALLGVAEQPQIAAFEGRQSSDQARPSLAIPQPHDVEHLLRMLTPVVKGVTSKAAVTGLAECIESMGGVGYLENEAQEYNIARLHRDAIVNTVWEGTCQMMAHDLQRVLYGKTSQSVLAAMDAWVGTVLGRGGALADEAKVVRSWWNKFRQVLSGSEKEDMEMRALEMMNKLGDVVMGTLLIADAQRDGEESATITANVWITSRERGEAGVAEQGYWHDRATRDKKIVYGRETLEDAIPKL